MRNFYFSTLVTLLFSTVLPALIHAQVYVDINASGNNDGSSWANAYEDIQQALNAEAPEIWVAKGTYKPGKSNADSTATFSVNYPVRIYGGFAGTENSLAQRDVENNQVRLSGDLQGNDVSGDFLNFRSDNVLHVMYVDSMINAPVVLDGLYISGGRTSLYTDQPEYVHRGGGIYALSVMELNNCHFDNNFGVTAAALYLSGSIGNVDHSKITNCTFTQNYATARACIYTNFSSDILIEDCEFKDNTGDIRGVFYPAFCDYITINRCTFDNNTNPNGFGSSIWNWHSSNLFITNSVFKNNFASNAGAVYLDSRNRLAEDMNIIIDNCTFDNNTAGSWCSGVYLWQVTGVTVSNSTFINNTHADGGALYHDAQFVPSKYDVDALKVIGCTFESNTSTNFWSGAVHSFGGSMTVDSCDFKNNQASLGAAISFAHIEESALIKNCRFEGGKAVYGGGAIAILNDSTNVDIIDCVLFDNEASNDDDEDGAGGAIYIENGVDLEIKNTHFNENKADIGGALSGTMFTGLDPMNIKLSNCIIEGSIANYQGGAVSILGGNMEISNLLAFNNFALGKGTGGAFSINASDSTSSTVDIMNSTIVNNFGLLASGFAQWDTLTGKSTLKLQNTILYNDGADYFVEGGNPDFISNGGNLSGNEDMATFLSHVKDQSNVDPLFVDADESNFRLRQGSPAIDAGVTLGSPEFDLSGNQRIGDVDAGAFEFDISTNTINILDNSNLLVMPNPITDFTQIQIDNDWQGRIQLELTNALGQRIQSIYLTKYQDQLIYPLDMSQLSSGMYQLSATQGRERMIRTLLKL